MIEVSIIVPCFNTGIFLSEALKSVFDSGFDNYEIVVVNDGSEDRETLDILFSINFPKVKVIHQENKGLSSARNFGVNNSKGDILFFLDSDNRVKKGCFEKAMNVFLANSLVGVVYSKPYFFGEKSSPRFIAKPFNFDSLLAGNYIDACAFLRRKAFEEVRGFDENRALKISEDWDFWIRVGKTPWKFHFLNEELFDYRVRKDSMIGENDQTKISATLHYLGSKHGYLFHQHYRRYFKLVKKIEKSPFTFFLRILYYKYILRKSLLD